MLSASLLQLAAWIMLSTGVSIALRTRPLLVVGAALVLWSLVPATAAYRVTGQDSGPLAAHPATWLLLALAAVCALTRPDAMLRVPARRPVVAIILGAVVLVAIVTTGLMATSGSKLLLDQLIGPIVLFWMVVAFGNGDRGSLRTLRNTIVAAVSLQCLLAVIEWWFGRFLLYESDYTGPFDATGFNRWMGTTDSHLVLAFAICVAAPLTVGLRNPGIRLALLILQSFGALVTQSRFVLAALVGVYAYLFVKGRMTPITKVLTGSVLAVGMAFAMGSTLSEGVRDRLSDDNGSAGARARAFDAFGGMIDSYWFVGDGLMANYDVARFAGLGTSFESSALMYAVDIGVIWAALYFGVMLATIWRDAPGSPFPGAAVSAVLALGSLQVFSGLGYSNLSGTYLWAVLGLLAAGSRQSSRSGDHDTSLASSRTSEADRSRSMSSGP